MKKIISILTVILILFQLTACKKHEQTDIPVKYIPVETQSIIRMTLSDSSSHSGKTLPYRQINAVSKISGIVESVEGEYGKKVKEGDILFTLEKESIEDNIRQAELSLEAAKINFNKTVENVNNARLSLERNRKLLEEGAVASVQIEQLELAASDNNIKAAANAVDQARFLYEKAEKPLEDIAVRAPEDGIVISAGINKGDYVPGGQPLISIINIDKILVRVNISENLINGIQNNSKVSLFIPSASDGEYTGTVEKVSLMAEPVSMLFPVEISVLNPTQTIKPGMFATVVFETDIHSDVMAIKSEAVMHNENEDVVFVVKDNKAIKTPIEKGIDNGLYVEILKGLNGDESIIVRGQNYVEDGDDVTVIRGDEN